MRAPDEPLSWVIRTKLAPPQVGFSAVERPRLSSDCDRRLTLISAPPGFGKSTLMTQLWTDLRARNIAAAWLSLDRADAQPKALISYVVVSLLAAGAELAPLAGIAESGFAGLGAEQIATLLINALLEDGRTCVVFLDDFHLVEGAEVNALVRFLITKAPGCLRFVIGTRTQPALGLAALRARGELAEVTLDSLRLTTEEIESLLVGRALSADAGRLRAKTEGWPVAVQLALIGRDRPCSPDSLASFSGSTEEVADYLLEEVLGDLPEADQTFLCLTSITERLTGDLANAITGRDDGWAVLDGLRRRGLPVVPLDPACVWFRYHQMLTEYLRGRLSRSGANVAALHARAAGWFANAGHVQEAITHAALADDPELGPSLIERHGGWRVLLRNGVAGLQALSNLPSPLPAKFVLTTLAQVMLKAIDSQHEEARALLKALRSSVDEADARLEADHWCLDVVLQCYEDASFDVASLRAAADRFQTGDAPPSLRLLARNLAVIGLVTEGHTREAATISERLLEDNRALEVPYAELYVAIYRGLAKLRLGETDDAEAVFRHIAEEAERRFGANSNHVVSGELLLAWAALAKGDCELARRLVEPRLPTLEFQEGTCDIFVAAFETGLALARGRGDAEAIEGLLDKADGIARSRGWPRLAALAVIWRMRELLAFGELDDARALESELATLAAAPPACGSAWLVREDAGLVLVKSDIEHGRFGDALYRLHGLTAFAAARHHQGRLAELVALRAAALAGQGQTAAACNTWRQAQSAARSRGLQVAPSDQAPRCRALLETLGEDGPPSIARIERAAAHGAMDATRQDVPVTPREQQILDALARGLSNKEAARALDISEDTVKFHRRNLYRKLGAHTRSALLANARHAGALA